MDQICQCLQGFLHRGERIEMVNEVDVDTIRLQSFQALFHREHDMAARRAAGIDIFANAL